ncbi:MAG TPA: CHAD domain-containing protein [Trebonia sp.]|nr:CHAD domain-containing protein [Trebonia sp.]
MTPGLAGFVVASDEMTWDSALDEALEALRGAFEVVLDQGSTPGGTRRTWFDTFDWRLYRAGLSLEYVATRRAGELVVTGTDGNRAVAGPASSWRATRSYHASDLPDGPATRRIAGLIAPRALLPMVTVSTAGTVARLLNADGKTVARVLVERPAVEDRPLPPRLAVGEVRGYPAQARRAARLISLAPGIEPASAEGAANCLLKDALRAIGRRPGDYSNKVDAKITADMAAPKAVATILLALLDALEANVDGVLRDTDTEFLHDLRVAVRRTRAAIKLIGDALGLPDQEYDRFAAEFKWLGDQTTPVRDLDVHLLDFDVMASRLRAAKEDDLVPFRTFLQGRRAREFRALSRCLRSQRFTALATQWRAVLDDVADNSNKSEARGGAAVRERGGAAGRGRRVTGGERMPTAGRLAVGRTRQAFRKVTRRGGAITADSPPESLHDLRKRCKELRYVLEFFAPLHDKAAYSTVIGDLKKLQDCLGDFQDNEVQIEEIRALADAMLRAGPVFNGAAVPAGTLLAMGELTAGLAASQQAARAAFEARFASFAGPQAQGHMAVLLEAR